MQCEKYTQAAFMTLSPDNIFRITDRNLPVGYPENIIGR